MPELAEVAYYASQWASGLGERVTAVHLHPEARVFRDLSQPASQLESAVEGQVFKESRTHGKQLFFRFGQSWLAGHLGMTGKLRECPIGDSPGRHDHLVLTQARRQLVFFDPRMFGRWRLLDARAMEDLWRALPPAVTDRRFTKRRLEGYLGRHTRAPLKGILLDQAMFPGIGNWMADEVLWRVGLDPRRPAGDLSGDEVALLWKKLRLVCRQALRIIGRSWGSPPEKTWLFPHRWKAGGRCPCGTPLSRAAVAGRTTAWCPRCQPGL